MKGENRRDGRLSLRAFALLVGLPLIFSVGCARRPSTGATTSMPLFTRSFTAAGRQFTYTIVGRSPEQGGTTTIPTALVPVTLVFDGYKDRSGAPLAIGSSGDVKSVLASPIFQKFPFATGNTQYADAIQRAEFYKQAVASHWHTLFAEPHVLPALQIEIPAADGYVLTSKRTGRSLAIVDRNFVLKQFFRQISNLPVPPSTLVIALTKNADFYAIGDATVCCSWGLHGLHRDPRAKSSRSFVFASYLDPGVAPRFSDIQPLTQQIAEWMNDPLQGDKANKFPRWRDPSQDDDCGGDGVGSAYRYAEPTDGGTFPNATPVTVNGVTYHLENVALPSWFAQNSHPDTFQGAYSFPDTRALTGPAQTCASYFPRNVKPTASPLPNPHAANGHQLIGYWTESFAENSLPLRGVSPQWDVVIVAFAPPEKGSTSILHFAPPRGYTPAQFKAEIQALQRKGRKVLISLGGGGQVVTLKTPEDLRDFVASVSTIVQTYGFNGIDLDFETPSLILNPGDTNFRKPTTPAIVNLISAMHQLHRRFGPQFMLAEVPEGPQVPAALETYAGQFGSFLPVIYGTRHILSFVDVQNYDTPPLEALDGNYYMPRTADYYVAMTEMLLHGFPVGRDPKSFFPPLPPQKVAIGFLVGRSPLGAIEQSLRYLIEGKPYARKQYDLLRRSGYPDLDGVMFWNIQADRWHNYELSNAVGPLLHELPPARR
jgi:chitinase